MDEHTLNDLLECSVCLERLDTSSKVLPCQHTFCRKCLEVIYASREELRCPECRILVVTKIEELPPNVLLMRILEGIKNAGSKQHSIINEVRNEKKEPIQTATGSGKCAPSVNDEGSRQQIQQQQFKQRQQQILQFQQQIQQQHHVHQQQNQSTISQRQPLLQQQQSQNRSRRCIVPHAFALYDFESSEETDLSFKKGDLIFLKRKLDGNWYFGQLKGAEGNFPINYVQIVVPLPTSQCVALYDFKMGPNEEEGCLTFKKGTLIHVLRRVDYNWAEGRIGTSVGIFPIAFVELNQMAKQLLEFSAMSFVLQQQPTQYSQQAINNDVRNLPPLPPVIDPPTDINYIDLTSSVSPPTKTTSSSSNSSTTTSPTTTSAYLPSSSNSASFRSMPNSPQSSKPSTPQHSITNIANSTSSVQMRNNDLKHKRHSLNSLLSNGSTGLSITQPNRHSAEILSVPNNFDNKPTCSTMSAAATGPIVVDSEQKVLSDLVSNQYYTNTGQNDMQRISSTLQQGSLHNAFKTCVKQNIPPSLPWGYLALYPYKPSKPDELELKKGCVYMVTERCLDGWVKGNNWKDASGVFPGNYVTPLRTRDQQQLMYTWKLVPPSETIQPNYSTTPNQSTTSTSDTMNLASLQQQISPSYPSSMRNDLENINARLTLANLTPHQAVPPDLPPRYLTISPTPHIVIHNNNANMPTKEHRDKEAQKEKSTTTGCISTSSSSSSTTSASTGLKKFLTHIKSRSKSPSAAIAAAAVAGAASSVAIIQANVPTQTPHQQNPQHLQKPSVHSIQTNMNTSSLTAIHVRSGSCPSQLLQNLPSKVLQDNMVESKNPTHGNTQQSQPQQNYSSHRIKGGKERTALENTRSTIDSTLSSIYANHTQQQSSLMTSKCGQHYQKPPLLTNSSSSSSTGIIHHRKSHSLDASNILHSSTSSPTSSFFNNTGGGGSVTALKTTPQCNINAAAIHASATTKSTQNMSESRFRCVVPYPPNSDVELELQGGDVIFVYRKQKNGWYKGTNSRTYKTGLFPASFVEPDI